MAFGIDTTEPLGRSRIKEIRPLVSFVGRYIYPNWWKGMSHTEAKMLSRAGIWIVSIFERNPVGRQYFIDEADKDAELVNEWAYWYGQPADGCVYLTVDYDAPPNDLNEIENYIRRIYKTTKYPLGIYGSGFVCEEMKKAFPDLRTWLSESKRWRGSQVAVEAGSHFNIVQELSQLKLSFEHSIDRSDGNAGGWRLKNA